MTNSRSIWALALMVQNRFHDPHDTSGQAWWACKHLAENRRLFTVEDEACRKLIGFLPYNARARARILMNMVQYSFAFACLFPMVVFESISRAHRVNVKTTIYISDCQRDDEISQETTSILFSHLQPWPTHRAACSVNGPAQSLVATTSSDSTVARSLCR